MEFPRNMFSFEHLPRDQRILLNSQIRGFHNHLHQNQSMVANQTLNATASSSQDKACSADFGDFQPMKMHASTQTENEPYLNSLQEFSIVCPHCLTRFKSQVSLNEHMPIHITGKKFSCSLCALNFSRKCDLQGHMNREHLGMQMNLHSPERKIACNQCPLRFKRKDHYERHVRYVHTDERPFSCTQCAGRFKRKQSLMRHVSSVHYNERNYSCDYCTLQFKRSEHLQKHMHSHMNKYKQSGYQML